MSPTINQLLKREERFKKLCIQVTTTDVNGDGTLLQQAVDRKKDFVRILLEFGFVSLFLGFSSIPNLLQGRPSCQTSTKGIRSKNLPLSR